MKNTLKKIIHVLLFYFIRSAKWQRDDIQAQALINSMSDEVSYIPLTGWSMRPSVIVHILNEILINNKKMVVEFGSGYTTICIARLCKLYNLKASLISVDSSKEWIEILEKQLENEALNDYVQFIYAPTKVSNFDIAENNQWYDQDILDNELNIITKIDMVIVDGPPEETSSFSRFGAFPYLKDKLNKNYTIVLDDTDRKQEKKILKLWETESGVESSRKNGAGWIIKNDNKNRFSSEPLFYNYDSIVSFSLFESLRKL